MHKQAINHKQAIIGGGYLFTENACYHCDKDPTRGNKYTDSHEENPTSQVTTTSEPFLSYSMSVRDKFDRQTWIKNLGENSNLTHSIAQYCKIQR